MGTTIYTKDEVKRAKEAHEFIKNSGYPSLPEARHIIIDGNKKNPPELTGADFERAQTIYGVYPENVKGKLTRKAVPRAKVDPMLRLNIKEQKLYKDVMHIDGKKFLITVTEPLNLTLQSYLEIETRSNLGFALQGHLGMLRSRGFIPVTVFTVPHSSFKSMTQEFAGVDVDVGGASDYVPKVDAKIRRIKETYRCVKHALPWKLPHSKVKDLVAYAVSRLNIRRISSLSENVCPRVLFTGIKIDYKKELNLSLGDYVEAYEKTDNTSTARTSACVALFPSSNAAGSWTLWKLDSNCNVQRTRFVKVATTEEVITKINVITDGEEIQQGLVLDPKESEICEGGSTRDTTMITEDNKIADSLVSQEEQTLDGIEEEADDSQFGMRTRSGRTMIPSSKFLGVTRIPEGNLMSRKTEEAISAELKQLFEDLQALHPVLKEDIPPNTKVLRSHMFVVEKYPACGKVDKMKARLVADG